MSTQHPNYLFEISWEVCNKVGGIHTELAGKAPYFKQLCTNDFFMIGPDVWRERGNTEFTEDRELYRTWHEQAEQDGLHFRIGRWNIPGNPTVLLIDYTSFFSQKDDIFKELWENYKLDSISGQWDYIEPAIFGYAAGKIVEHFYKYNVMPNEQVLVQFHEWMTGSGVLYLKSKAPQIATAFTAHATVIGRTIAANNLPLYREMSHFNVEQLSNSFYVRAKHSLEKLAAENTDVFTTVSEMASKQCLAFLGKAVDKITESGLGEASLPDLENYHSFRNDARNKLKSIAEALLNQQISDDALFVMTGGRYEFKNKGLDIFIQTLGKLNASDLLKKQVLAVIAVPASNSGARPEILNRVGNPDFNNPISQDFCTHYLNDPSADLILNKLNENGLNNAKENMVKVLFVPCYLNGQDGMFDLDYCQLLYGFDATVFSSYYEPWGYTPMESAAYKIPTVTTSLTGFGQWVKQKIDAEHDGIRVVERTDDNDHQVVSNIADWLIKLTTLNKSEWDTLKNKVSETAQKGLWNKQVVSYEKAHAIALEKMMARSDNYTHVPLPFNYGVEGLTKKSKPEWKKVLVRPNIPNKLQKLHELLQNLWWCWDYEATNLFESINPDLFNHLERNPIALLNSMSISEIEKLENDTEFLTRLDGIYERFKTYMNAKTDQTPKVAYFSMEFGLHESVKIYSGGLGILAGDYLKEASDCNYNMIGIGLLYRYGYFKQQISINGEQFAHSIPQRFTDLPLLPVRDENGRWIEISISLPGRLLHAKVWRLNVGRVPLFLLDTDIETNSEQDRAITHNLYGGDWENRLKQEILLGVGGIRAIRKMDIKPDLFHCNEGHAAFIGLERLRQMIEDESKSFVHAKELVRASTLFTTHTPVPAGHDAFSEDLMRTYISHYPKRLGITWQALMGLGRWNENDPHEKFSMSVLAANLSQEMNGVSRIHGRVSREMFVGMYDGYYPEELHIGYVTNGIHYKTWTNEEWQKLHAKYFGKNFEHDMSNPEHWKGIENATDSEIWELRTKLRTKLIDLSKIKLEEDMTAREENPTIIQKALEGFDYNKLTIGFARRFATYKRAQLLFTDLSRLAKIVNHPTRPTQFVFAGKAHPADKAGQDLIKLILDISRRPEFIGKIFFLENYNIEIAKRLVQGVDIWMNTPMRPLEASGTSGEKAIMNGVLNLSVLDGWWAEGYRKNAGWALKEKQTYHNDEFQNALDAETIYNLIENEITDAFYDVDQNTGVSKRWIDLIKNNFMEISPNFTMKRQLDDYIKQYYTPQFERSKMLLERNGRKAHELAQWKVKVAQAWNNLEVLSVNYPDSTQNPLRLGDVFEAELVIDLKELAPEDIGVELIYGQKKNDVVDKLLGVYEMKLTKVEGSIATFKLSFSASVSGVFDFAFRIFPTHLLLPHRQDFNLIKWS
jgi:phosphorylase/glycogen(starch) synthase